MAAYDAQGHHRTATQVDCASAEWLAERARAAGATPRLAAFAVERLEIASAELRVGERTEPGVPLFDAGPAPPEGIEGRLGPLGSGAEIGVASAAPVGASGERLLAERRADRHRALVVAPPPPDAQRPRGLALHNAESYTQPFGPPTLQVSNVAWTWPPAVEAGARAHLRIEARRVPAEARNVVCEIGVAGGGRPDAAPVVIMTPRSGWFRCASERGPGLAVWLELLRAVVQARLPGRAIFIATSGHELGHLGLRAWLEASRSLVRSAALTLHLGANFAAARGGAILLQASDAELRDAASRALEAAAAPPSVLLPVERPPAGEAAEIHALGGRFASLIGSNALFHTEADRWPEAVDAPRAARVVAALWDLLRIWTRGAARA